MGFCVVGFVRSTEHVCVCVCVCGGGGGGRGWRRGAVRECTVIWRSTRWTHRDEIWGEGNLRPRPCLISVIYLFFFFFFYMGSVSYAGSVRSTELFFTGLRPRPCLSSVISPFLWALCCSFFFFRSTELVSTDLPPNPVLTSLCLCPPPSPPPPHPPPPLPQTPPPPPPHPLPTSRFCVIGFVRSTELFNTGLRPRLFYLSDLRFFLNGLWVVCRRCC